MRTLAVASLLVARVALAAPPSWIEDDWPRAAAEARERHVPILVEAWVPW